MLHRFAHDTADLSFRDSSMKVRPTTFEPCKVRPASLRVSWTFYVHWELLDILEVLTCKAFQVSHFVVWV